jgi:hypothetical protein
LNGEISELLHKAHESQIARVACRVHALTQPSHAFLQTTRAAALAKCEAVGRAYRLAFSYGQESDRVVAATLFSQLARSTPHAHVPFPLSTYKTMCMHILDKDVCDAFKDMPNNSAPRRDGRTWKLFRDATNRPSMAHLFKKFVEMFGNGHLPKSLWKLSLSAIMIPL